jgi:hypothetical protein
MPNTIVLKGRGHHEERVAAGAISPGMVCEVVLDTTLKVNQVQVTKAEYLKTVGLLVAKEDALQGNTVDTAYATGDTVFYYTALPGDHIQLLVKSGENITLNDKLVVEGGGSGMLVESGGSETRYQAKALETTGALGANTLVACVVL